MTDMLIALGAMTALCAGWMLILLALLGLVRMSNWTAHRVLDAYGGWQTFKKFRHWYWQQPENQKENNHD